MLNLSKIAKDVTGTVSGFREVLDHNLSKSPFQFPPQIASGIEIVESLGFDIPDEEDIVKYLGNSSLLRDVNSLFDVVEGLDLVGLASRVDKSSSEVLNSINWLIGN